MKRILIEVWLGDEEEVSDLNVGRALGEALVTNNLQYYTVEDSSEGEIDE